ncbi:MAG: hypothetical protein J6V28_04600 [Tidjanibacter sp.]|nr:hypothetical protein [Tidjanibacter sp.]
MKRLATVGLVLSLMATLFVSCGECYEKMQKKQDQIQVTCVPEVLTLKGSTVDADLTVSFPEMFFDPETILKITPVFVYGDGEVACAPKYVQGEDVVGNYTAISRIEGGSYTQHISFPFEKAVVGTLELRIEAKCFDECKETPDFTPWATVAAAKGISAVQALAQGVGAVAATAAIVAPVAVEQVKPANGKVVANGTDYVLSEANFERSSVKSAEAEIKYQINSSTVNKKQLSQEQIALFKEFVAANSAAERTTLGNLYASGYASPDGPEKFNNKLSEKCSQTGAKAMKNQLKGVEGLNYEIASYGEDWDGFKTLVENSNIEDKDLILNVLQMYSSPIERDQEIKNMSAVFKVLAEEILPELRRTRFAVEATYAGLTDEEILAAAKAGCTKLDIEHLLHAATLTDNVAEKSAIYELAANTYGDARAYNNLGVCKVLSGDLKGAKAAFEKAEAQPEVAGNLAAVALAMGDLESAKKYLSSADAEAVKATQGALALAEGNYQEAKANLNGYNLAIAELCDNNVEGAKKAIAEVKGADADYVRAIIANREGDADKAAAYLKSAVAAKPELKAQAQNDIEFYELLQTIEL